MKTFVWSFIVFVVTLALIFAIIFAPSYLKSQQEKRDRSIGCLQYRQMLELSQESHKINPVGKKWVRESMAAQGLMNKYNAHPSTSKNHLALLFYTIISKLLLNKLIKSRPHSVSYVAFIGLKKFFVEKLQILCQS